VEAVEIPLIIHLPKMARVEQGISTQAAAGRLTGQHRVLLARTAL